MTIGHNNGPPLTNLTPTTKIECIKSVLDRDDLSAAQKCVGVGLIVSADKDWVSEVSTDDLKRMATVKDRETVFQATRRLDELGLVSKQSKRGQAGRYTVLPPRVLDAIVEAYEDAKSGRVEPDQSEPKWSGETGRVGGSEVVGSNPTAFDEVVGSNPTGRVKPVGFDRTSRVEPDQSHARIDNNIYTNLDNNKPPLIPPTSADPDFSEFGFVFANGELRLVNGTAAKFATEFPGVDLDKICDRVAGKTVELKAESPNKILALIRTEARNEADKPKPKNAVAMPDKGAWDGEKLRTIAEKQGLSVAEGRLEFEAFKAHHLSKGNRFKDWYAAWRTWCLNHAKRGYGRKAHDPKTATATGMNYDWVLKTYGQRDEGAI